MTTNVICKSGVAYLPILIILSTFYFEQGYCSAILSSPDKMQPKLKPYDPANGPSVPPKLPSTYIPGGPIPDQNDPFKNLQGQKLFLLTKNSSWLEILKNGTVRGTTCKTKYGLLESHSHNGAQVFKGVASKLYLCMRSDGLLYAGSRFDAIDCGFLTKMRSGKSGKYPTYRHHKHHRLVQDKTKNNRTLRYYFGINCDGEPIVVLTKKQRRLKKDYIRFSEIYENTNPEDLTEVCPQSKCPPKTRNYLKFCREIRRRFFTATLKELRRFTKRDCWRRLSEARRKSKRRSRTKSERQRRRRNRNRNRKSHRESSDPT